MSTFLSDSGLSQRTAAAGSRQRQWILDAFTTNSDVFAHTMDFLPAADILRFCATCRCFNEYLHPNGVAGSSTAGAGTGRGSSHVTDAVWSTILRSLLGIDLLQSGARYVLPPASNAANLNPRDIFHRWKASFQSYRPSDVRFVRGWWEGIESWLALRAPHILATLEPPLSDAELCTLHPHADSKQVAPGVDVAGSSRARCRLPDQLALLYRFHNGQKLPLDIEMLQLPASQLPADNFDVVGDNDSDHEQDPTDWMWNAYSGLFGGYSYYDEVVNMRMAPAELLAPSRLGRVGGVRFLDAPNDAFVLAYSPLRSPKQFEVYLSSNKSGVPQQRCRVLCRGGRRTSEYAAAPGESDLYGWLDEYLRRLQSGYYGTRSMHDPELRPSSRVIGDRMNAISLFPQPISNESAGIGEQQKFVHVAVTRGVEVTASVVYCPEADRGVGNQWTYSISMRLLRDHASRPPQLTACQLVSRHWRIFSSNGRTEQVEGLGVVGEFPYLTIDDDPSRPFTYQSCNVSPDRGGTMGGFFRFRWADPATSNNNNNSNNNSNGSSNSSSNGDRSTMPRLVPTERGRTLASDSFFDVVCPEFTLDIPRYLY